MEILQNLATGFAVALEWTNLFYCFVGVALGVFVGVLPGLGSAATIAMLLPVTFYIEATPAVIMLSGIWYGSMFGGAVTAILIGVPGQSTAVMTVLDGHKMALAGKAEQALGAAVCASFAGGLIGFLGMLFIAPALARLALDFGPPEFFALTLGGLALVAYLATRSTLKAFIAAIVGLLLGGIGLDPITAESRFTFGTLSLLDGVGLAPMIMGLFGMTEAFVMVEGLLSKKPVGAPLGEFRAGLPERAMLREIARPTLKGGVIGSLVGILPGCGAAISSYLSYVLVKRFSAEGARFGEGAIGGVAAAESSNNSATCSGMIPLLTLGLPADIVPAIMLGAFLLHGVTPGPNMVAQNPEMFWGIVLSFLIGNLMLLAIMLPILRPISRITQLPSAVTAPMIALITIAGAYSIGNDATDIWVMLGFGVLGYLMRKFDYPVAPLVLAFVLGPIMETSLRQSLILSRGGFAIFLERPLSAIFIALAMLVIGSSVLSALRNRSADHV